MIDFGKLPRVLISAVYGVCAHADLQVRYLKGTAWADNAADSELAVWEQFLNIYSAGQSNENRRRTILAYLNANPKGKATIDWFYELAARLGFERGAYDKERNLWSFSAGYSGAAVFFSDGEFLPFRSGISQTGDKVYDNITYGANTCVCYFRQDYTAGVSALQLKDLILSARNIGTVLIFVKTD